jgi:hypothetical protein
MRWHELTGGAPEQYLAHLERTDGLEWLAAVWYASLVVSLRMGRVEIVGLNRTITRHNINRTTGVPVHEAFWTAVFSRTTAVTVLTTNYDILAERGLRVEPRPRVPRPGFRYGESAEILEGGGYPSYSHIRPVFACGTVPVLKLHGSVSWSLRSERIVRYHDCRPAIRGDALIVAPASEKRLPDCLRLTWETARESLASAATVIAIGYSLPEYDRSVIGLLRSTNPRCRFHVFDPDCNVVTRYEGLLGRTVVAHPGLPDGLRDIADILTA